MGKGNPHFACSYSFVQESKQPQSIAVVAEAEAREGELTRRVIRDQVGPCATAWMRDPLSHYIDTCKLYSAIMVASSIILSFTRLPNAME